jgi:hypothetical protein
MTFELTGIGAFFLVVGVEFDGVLPLWELGILFDGVATVRCWPSCGRKDGRVFLIDANGRTGVV